MKISILTANYNNKPFLVDFFDSLLNSTIKCFEVIFVDDCSTDESLSVVDEYKVKFDNFTLIALKKNSGFANALNEGLKICKGEYIARIDPDDIMNPNRLVVQLNFLEKNMDIGVLGSQARYFISDAKKLINSTNKPIGHDKIKKLFYQRDNGVLHGTVMIRSNVYSRYKYHQDEVPSEDYALFSRMIFDGVKFENINENLTFVRIHKNSVSNNLKYSTVEKVFLIRKKIFNINYNKIDAYREFLSLYMYRSAMYQKYSVLRWFFLLIAGFFGYERVFRRFCGLVKF